MKAAIWDKIGHIVVQDIPELKPKKNEVKVKIEYAGVCYNDPYIRDGFYSPMLSPETMGIFGHEYCGTIVEVGSDVPDYIKIGSKMAGNIQVYCGQCYYCHNGMEHFCEHKTLPTGSFAEYCVTPWTAVELIPDEVPFEKAVFTEVLSACIHGFDEANNYKIHSGHNVAIMGGGSMAQIRLMLAIRGGAAKVAIIEPQAEKREMAKRNGADLTIDPTTEDVVAIAKDATDGRGFDIVIDDANTAQSARLCLDIARPCATVLWGGNYLPDDTVEVPLQMLRSYKMLTIKTTIQSPYTFQRAVSLLPKLDLEPLISKVYPLSEVNAALDHQKSGKDFTILIKP